MSSCLHVSPRPRSSLITPRSSLPPHPPDLFGTPFGPGFLAMTCSRCHAITLNTTIYGQPRPARKIFFHPAKQTQPPLCASVPLWFPVRHELPNEPTAAAPDLRSSASICGSSFRPLTHPPP